MQNFITIKKRKYRSHRSYRDWLSFLPAMKQEMALLKDAILTDSDLEKDEVLQKARRMGSRIPAILSGNQ